MAPIVNAAVSVWKKDLRRFWPLGLLASLCIVIHDTHPLLGPVLKDPQLREFLTSISLPGLAKTTAVAVFVLLLIQADPLRNESPFWRSRPISAGSLVTGKALSLLLFVFFPALASIGWAALRLHADPAAAAAIIGRVALLYAVLVGVTAIGAAATQIFLTGALWTLGGLCAVVPLLSLMLWLARYRHGVMDLAWLLPSIVAFLLALFFYQLIYRRAVVTGVLLVLAGSVTFSVLQKVSATAYSPNLILEQSLQSVAEAAPTAGAPSVVPSPDLYTSGYTPAGTLVLTTVKGHWLISGTDDTTQPVIVRAESSIREPNGQVDHLGADSRLTLLGIPNDGAIQVALGLRSEPKPWIYPPPSPGQSSSYWRRDLIPLFSAPTHSMDDQAFRPRGELRTTLYFRKLRLSPVLSLPVAEGASGVRPGARLTIRSLEWAEDKGLLLTYETERLSPGPNEWVSGLYSRFYLVNRLTREYSQVSGGLQGESSEGPLFVSRGSYVFRHIRKDGAPTGETNSPKWFRNAELVELQQRFVPGTSRVDVTLDHFQLYRRLDGSDPMPLEPKHRRVEPFMDF